MVLDRLKQVTHHVSGTPPPPHPFDPLSSAEIEKAVALVNKEHGPLYYNAVTVWEPRKAQMLAWLADSEHTQRPHRIADVVAIKKGGAVYDGLVDLDEGKILKWESNDGVQPLITMEDLQVVEHVVRKDPKVIEQPHPDDSQYSYPLDFTPIFNCDKQEIVHIDVPPVRRPVNQAPPNNYHSAAIEAEGGFRKDLKPLHITQPEGVSFKVDGRIIEWQNWKVHVGFNYRGRHCLE
ncbi:peroxisomal copper amine oxidase [Lecanora helva]